MRSKSLFLVLISFFFVTITLSAGTASASQNGRKGVVPESINLPVEQRLLDVVILDDGQSRTPWFLMRLFKPGETPLTYVYDDGTTVLEIVETEDCPPWPSGRGKQLGLPPGTKLVSVSWQHGAGKWWPKFVTRPMKPGEKAEAYSFANRQTWHMIYERDK